jgi:hypothetical protein
VTTASGAAREAVGSVGSDRTGRNCGAVIILC